MPIHAKKPDDTENFIVALAEYEKLTKSEALLILDLSSLLASELYDIDELGIRLKSHFTDIHLLKNLFPEEIRELSKIEIDARLLFPCTIGELIKWRDRNEPSCAINQSFIDYYNCARSLFEETEISHHKKKLSRLESKAGNSGQAKIEIYNNKNSIVRARHWKPLVRKMEELVRSGMSYTQAARSVTRETDVEPQKLIYRFKYELSIGKIRKPIPDQS